ncbi:hypothetical protein HX13_03750 [Chryseobacterium sp. P1-3]|nr:hypothetical protein HX13_03750 [Chryseobacterium sp. P1-3]
MTDVIRFAALWCPDFPTSRRTGNQQADFLADAKIRNFGEAEKRKNKKTINQINCSDRILKAFYGFLCLKNLLNFFSIKLFRHFTILP